MDEPHENGCGCVECYEQYLNHVEDLADEERENPDE